MYKQPKIAIATIEEKPGPSRFKTELPITN